MGQALIMSKLNLDNGSLLFDKLAVFADVSFVFE
jgi:hypothetical protein